MTAFITEWPAHIGRWWGALRQESLAGALVLQTREYAGFNRALAVLIALAYGAYGVSMGLFGGGFPAFVAGLKLPLLFLFTIVVCFPALYVLNALRGVRLTGRQCLRLLLMGVSMNALGLASFVPVSYFFVLTSSNDAYIFLVFMHVCIFAAAGLLSLGMILWLMRATARAAGQEMTLSTILLWGAMYALVGSQMSWSLRPWVADPNQPYQWIRPVSGSFFEAVWNITVMTLNL